MISSNWTRENLAWLAGLLEGEGSFCLRNGRLPQVQMSMTDEDVVRRAHEIAGLGLVHGPYVVGTYKPQWKFVVQNQYHAYALMVAVAPWLGARRRQAVEGTIASWLEWCELRPAQIRRGVESRRKITPEVRARILSEYNGVRWGHGQAHRLCVELGLSMKTLYNVAKGRQ